MPSRIEVGKANLQFGGARAKSAGRGRMWAFRPWRPGPGRTPPPAGDPGRPFSLDFTGPDLRSEKRYRINTSCPAGGGPRQTDRFFHGGARRTVFIRIRIDRSTASRTANRTGHLGVRRSVPDAAFPVTLDGKVRTVGKDCSRAVRMSRRNSTRASGESRSARRCVIKRT
jgi:hypothetical protein